MVIEPDALELGEIEARVVGTNVPGQVGYPGSDRQPYALVVSGGMACALPAPVGATLRVTKDGPDAVLTWDPPAGTAPAAHDVATLSPADDFTAPTLAGTTESPRWRHPDVIGEDADRYYRVAAVSACGRRSDWR